MKRIMAQMALVAAMLLGMAACDVHEFPEPQATTPLVLRLRFDTDLPQWDFYYKRKTGGNQVGTSLVPEDVQFRNAQLIQHQGKMQVIMQAHDLDGRCADVHAAWQRDLADGYDCDVPVQLPAGRWQVRVWAMLSPDGEHWYYDAANFNAITLLGSTQHEGNNDYRDAYRGIEQVTMQPVACEADVARPDTCVVPMERPLAKYEFVSTDLRELTERIVAATSQAAPGDAPKQVNFDNYTVRIIYPTYMPSVYSMGTDRPVDSWTNMSFNSRVTPLNATEASIGFDWVWVNHQEAVVTVMIALYNEQGQQISLTSPIDVPLLRSRHTIMRGAFLTENAQSGLGIDPSYDGDYNITIN